MGLPRQVWRVCRLIGAFAIGLLTVWLILHRAAPAEAPSEPNGPGQPPDAVLETLEGWTPLDWQSWINQDSAGFSTAPVQFDGYTLFYVAAPDLTPNTDVTPNTDEGNALTAQQRANEIERSLYRVARRGIDPEDLSVTWEIEDTSNQPVVYVNEQPVFTVTYLDTQLQAYSSIGIRAEELTNIVREALLRYRQERQVEYLWRQAELASGIFVLTLLANYAITNIRSNLRQRSQRLEQTAPAPAAMGTAEQPITTALRHQIQARQQQGLLDLERALLKLAQWSVWLVAIFYCLGLFPQTRWLQPVLINALRLPIQLGILALATYWVLRLSNVWLDRLFIFLQEGASLAPDRPQRLGQRFSTFSQVTKNIVWFVALLIAGLIGLTMLGVRVGPILTGAGLLGLAVSLASQGLIQDFINGFLILLEDHYGIGDVIVVDNVSGFVETMNLRITQLRNEEGRLITIPNSKIGIVQNLSKEWSRVDLQIPVALSADINRALSLIEQVANQMRKDTIWSQMILEPPLLLGVEQLDHVGAIVRLWIKTLPLKQWDVAREYRRRLKIAFEDAGIPLGMPQQIIQVASLVNVSNGHQAAAAPFPPGSAS